MPFILRFIYNIFYMIAFVIMLPSYLLKQKRRGGWGTGLMERFGWYRVPFRKEPKDVLYVHAVSVGEVMIALKFIKSWIAECGGEVVLATSTATGHATAKDAKLDHVRVIYSPWDLPFISGICLDRFDPIAIALVEAELWPNFARAAEIRNIPISMINARLSYRSEKRYKSVKWLSTWFFSPLKAMGVQDKDDASRFASIGVNPDIITVTGSIKFDQPISDKKELKPDFEAIIYPLAKKKPIVLAASTHDGEEALIAEAIHQVGGFPLIVPRHAERRHDVVKELSSRGWQCILRTSGEIPSTLKDKVCYIVDTTGELKDWTAFAQVAIIGKSFLAVGGQNPAEAVACCVPVIAGPHMENFDAFVHLLESVDGITRCSDEDLAKTLDDMLQNELMAHAQATRALVALKAHHGATIRTIRMIYEMIRDTRY